MEDDDLSAEEWNGKEGMETNVDVNGTEKDVMHAGEAWRRMGLKWNDGGWKKWKCVRRNAGKGAKSVTGRNPGGNIKNYLFSMSNLKEMDGMKSDGRKRCLEDDEDDLKAPKLKKGKIDQKYAETLPRNPGKTRRALNGGAKSLFERGTKDSMQLGRNKEGNLGVIKPMKANLLGNPLGLRKNQGKCFKKGLLQEGSCQFSTDLQLYPSNQKAEED